MKNEAGTEKLLRPDAPHPTTMLVVQRPFFAGYEEARDFVLNLLGDDGSQVYKAQPWVSGGFTMENAPTTLHGSSTDDRATCVSS